MKNRLFFLLLVTGLLLLAIGGWTVQGLRWATRAAGRAASRSPPDARSAVVVSLVNRLS